MVRGADGREYGPATLDQIAAWIREGRLSGQQLVKRNDMQDWIAASAFVEFQSLFRPATPPGAPPSATAPVAGAPTGGGPVNPAAVAHMRSGASWFYWIAALSLINSLTSLSGKGFAFAIGLGITHVFAELGKDAKGIVLAFDLLATGLFVLFGVFAHKGHTWAFAAGMVLFALDTLLVLLQQSLISVALHGLVLYFLFRGMQACRELNRAAAAGITEQ